MKILILCEESGTVREAFKARGHDAWSCDLLPSAVPGQHYQGDALDILKDWNLIGGKPDIIIGHPVCTRRANSGVRWLNDNPERMELLRQDDIFFNTLWNCDIPKICLENPIPHKYSAVPKYTQIVQPYMFGHPESKATCLWLKGLPKLKESNNVKKEMMLLPKFQQQRIHYLPPSEDRAKIRSKTFSGLAEAMANQWG
jgi:hypothetical protein